MYGLKTRVLLNHDIVFLGEILSAISDSDSGFHGFASCQKINCFIPPKLKKQTAKSLQFAATVNLILSAIQIEDNISDTNSYFSKLTKRYFSKNFNKAFDQMERWAFPIKKLRQWANIQQEREKDTEIIRHSFSIPETLHYFSEPTATITGLTFMHGAKIVNKSLLKKTMYDLGYLFGKLIYFLDAYDDYERDFLKQKFNAWQKSFNISFEKIPLAQKQNIVKILLSLKNEIAEKIHCLPISPCRAKYFTETLELNLIRRISFSSILQNSCNPISNNLLNAIEKRKSKPQSVVKLINDRQVFQKSSISHRRIYRFAFSNISLSFIPLIFCHNSGTLLKNPTNQLSQCCENGKGLCANIMYNFGCESFSCCDCCCVLCILIPIGQLIASCCCGNNDGYDY